jgi:hypothetical protein
MGVARSLRMVSEYPALDGFADLRRSCYHAVQKSHKQAIETEAK